MNHWSTDSRANTHEKVSATRGDVIDWGHKGGINSAKQLCLLSLGEGGVWRGGNQMYGRSADETNNVRVSGQFDKAACLNNLLLSEK